LADLDSKLEEFSVDPRCAHSGLAMLMAMLMSRTNYEYRVASSTGHREVLT